jgi:hypothetical protein
LSVDSIASYPRDGQSTRRPRLRRWCRDAGLSRRRRRPAGHTGASWRTGAS